MTNLIETVEEKVLTTDNELLGRYLYKNDPLAFEELVRRHSGLVMGVCRSMLLHSHDSEDAFQVTFLILSRKSGSLINHGSIAGWLYQTALRNCLQIRRRKGRAREIEMAEEPVADEEPWITISNAQECELIYREINRLPKRYRDVIVLCHLEGQSRLEAAEFLALTESSVKAALARGRNLLRRRLIRSGLVTSAALSMLAAATTDAQESIAGPLITSTLLHCQGIPPTAPVGSGPDLVQSLSAHGVLSMQTAMFIKSITLAASFAIIVSIPLVLIAQKSELDNSANSMEAAFDPIQSTRISSMPPVKVASQDNQSNLTPNEAMINYAKQFVGLSSNIPAPSKNGARNLGTDETRSDEPLTVTTANLDSYSKEDSKPYWELMLKSYTTRANALETQANAVEDSKGDRLLLISERYEMEAKAVEAQLNLDRIKAATTMKAQRSKAPAGPLLDKSQNLNRSNFKNLNLKTGAGMVTGVSDSADMVAISTGSEDGIQVGQDIDIFRSQEYIARAAIIRAGLNTSTAKIVAAHSTKNIRAGDRVMVRNHLPLKQFNLNHSGKQIPATSGTNTLSTAEINPSNSHSNSIPRNTIPRASTEAVEPGEALLVESVTDKSLNRRVVVRADHTISLPLIGTISVKGATAAEITGILEDKFSKYVTNPHIFVVRESASTPIERNRR